MKQRSVPPYGPMRLVKDLFCTCVIRVTGVSPLAVFSVYLMHSLFQYIHSSVLTPSEHSNNNNNNNNNADNF